jgi:hypothetical protein
VFGHVVGAADQSVVDAIRQGDRLASVTLEGDVEALLADPRVASHVAKCAAAVKPKSAG